jgi:hypothetical protein
MPPHLQTWRQLPQLQILGTYSSEILNHRGKYNANIGPSKRREDHNEEY